MGDQRYNWSVLSPRHVEPATAQHCLQALAKWSGMIIASNRRAAFAQVHAGEGNWKVATFDAVSDWAAL